MMIYKELRTLKDKYINNLIELQKQELEKFEKHNVRVEYKRLFVQVINTSVKALNYRLRYYQSYQSRYKKPLNDKHILEFIDVFIRKQGSLFNLSYSILKIEKDDINDVSRKKSKRRS